MDKCKKEKHFMDGLEDHSMTKSSHEMDEKLNSAKKNLKGRT